MLVNGSGRSPGVSPVAQIYRQCAEMGLHRELIVLADTNQPETGFNGAATRVVQQLVGSVLVPPESECRYPTGQALVVDKADSAAVRVFVSFESGGALRWWNDRGCVRGAPRRRTDTLLGPCSRLCSSLDFGHHNC